MLEMLEMRNIYRLIALVSGSILDKGKEWRLGPPSFKAFRPRE